MQLIQTQQILREQETFFFTLTAPSGIRAKICSPGASLTALLLPDRTGHFDNVVLSLANPETYLENPFYAGAVLGPNAGRIRDGALIIGGRRWKLSANDGRNNLHGGRQCVSFANWTPVDSGSDEKKAFVALETSLADGQDGFPGNRRIRAVYTLNCEGALSLELSAVSDRQTYLNLSHHTYWNLSGDFGTAASIAPALRQQLRIFADYYIANDSSHLPREILPVQDTPFDFRTGGAPGMLMQRYPNHEQLVNARGYNNGFVLKHSEDGTQAAAHACASRTAPPAAVLSDSASGRRMSLFTDAPCLVLYSGGYLEGGPSVLDRDRSAIAPVNSCALALEAQDFPDAPGNPLFDCCFLNPHETWRRNIRWEFSLI